jgi:hypothetical protein
MAHVFFPTIVKFLLKKLESWVPKEREAIHSCFSGKMNGSIKIVNQFTFRKVVALATM